MNMGISQYNVGFYTPQKDACTKCTRFKNEAKAPEKVKKQEEHIERKDMSREERMRDISRSQKDVTFCAIIADLEQVSPCSKARTSGFFYVSKISCYNYSIYNLGTNDGFRYRWDETKAHRGAQEMASCLINFLKEVVHEEVKEVVVWADTCGCQFRNQYLSAVLLDIVNDTSNNFESIILKFFESGHSK